MKMYEIIKLSELYQRIKDIKMPIKLAYKFNCLMRKIEQESVFYSGKFKEIVDEYAQRDEKGEYIFLENGKSISIIPGREEECHEKISELQNLEVSIKGISFTLEDLEGLNDLNLSITEINSLMPLIAD